ncbi:uncharacterized protein LOC133530526 isoform X3 [Cydia pomonella]|uniref:uncharacterized protein LOC133530526 isoform X3 n=1 Tax=Cydia pomonella TaxID=82600 RepID=UPI002ADDE232|nr:uncharacterized protein LOC133530526 isoform X3 [Cydia pomonella]
MNIKVYKYCAVPQCKNTSIKTPNKLFVHVPKNKTTRYKWLKLAKRDPTKTLPTSNLYFCEDHFDMPNDMENYMEYHLMGSVSQIRMKPGCIPTRYQCQPDRIRTSDAIERSYILKKLSKTIIKECEKFVEDKILAMKQVELGETSSGSYGKAHTLFEPKIKRGEVHSDHSYALRNLPTDTANADGAASTDVQSALQEDEPAFEEDNDQMESDSRLPKDEVMIDYIIEHPVSPGRDIFETIEPEDKKKDTIFSWEKTELLETDDPEDEPVLVPETKIPEDLPTLSLFCDEPEKPPVEIALSKPEAVVPMDVVYRCVDCAVVVDGFTFWCVQCLCGVLCGTCAEISPHNIHYVLRAPKGATLSQTQPVLLVIREQLQKENLLTLYGTDVDCVKVEVKLEPEEPLSVCEDPLACAPRAAAPGRRHAEPGPEDADSHSEAGQSSVEDVEPRPAVQISLEGAEPHSEAVQFYLDGVEPHPEAVQFYLEAVERGSDAVLLQVETTSPGTEELHHEAAGPDNEARELQHDVRAEKRVNMETVSHHHPLKRHRLMTIRPGDKLNPTSPKVSDVQHQALKRIPPTIISQTVLRLPDAPSNRTGPKIQPRDPRKSETLSKCTPTELVVPQNVHKGPNILRRSKTNKVEIRKSTLLKRDMPKSSSLMTQQINPRGFPLQVSQNIKGFSGLKVTSGPRRYENSDDGDVEFLDEEILDTNYSDNEIDRLRKENQNEYRIDEEFVGDIESELGNDDLEDSRIDRLDKENRDGNISDESEKDDEESDKNSSKDKESEIDDDDLDEDFRIDEQDRTDEDSMDEKNSAEGVCRRTRHATNATVRNQRKRVQKLTSEAVVRLQRLTSLDIRNWTNRSKSRRKD